MYKDSSSSCGSYYLHDSNTKIKNCYLKNCKWSKKIRSKQFLDTILPPYISDNNKK